MKLDLDDGIRGTGSGLWTFFVNRGNSPETVIIVGNRSGRKHLKTENDGEEPNNLLSHPECPQRILAANPTVGPYMAVWNRQFEILYRAVFS